MAYAVYYQWDALGRPLEPAQPIRDVVDRMKAAYPKAAGSFSWFANEAHYQAEPPQDHTPYSATGWPQTSPEWWVFATDIMHNPAAGVDCNVLFAYWLGEARAGRMPWLKYMIWQAKLYDVRNSWKPQSNSGHFDHIHLSARTDFQHVGLGSWSLIPGEEHTVKPMLVKFADATDPAQVWYCDGQFRRRVLGAWWGSGKGPITNVQVHQAGLLGNLVTGPAGNGQPGQWDSTGTVFVSAGDPDVWGVDVATLQGGGGTVAGPVDLTAGSVTAVADATVDEMRNRLAG